MPQGTKRKTTATKPLCIRETNCTTENKLFPVCSTMPISENICPVSVHKLRAQHNTPTDLQYGGGLAEHNLVRFTFPSQCIYTLH